MQVQVEMKITILDGPEKGRTFNEGPKVLETQEDVDDPAGIVSTLNIKWKHYHPENLIFFGND